MRQELGVEDEVLYYNFITGEEYLPGADKVSSPEELVTALEQELLQVVDNAPKLVAQKFTFVYEFILVFKRNNYKLLANSIFCHKIINIDEHKNYTVSNIFDSPKYYRLTLDEIGEDKAAFVKAFAATSLFSKFVEDSYTCFYSVYIRGEEVDPGANPTYRFLKNIVNSYEVMPSPETKRKTFFEHNGFKVFSLLYVHRRELERFEVFNAKLKYREIHMEEYVRFYMDKTRTSRLTCFYSDRKCDYDPKATDISLLTCTVRSDRSFKGGALRIGKNYFKPIRTDRLVNVTLKDLSETQIDLKQMLDIFS